MLLMLLSLLLLLREVAEVVIVVFCIQCVIPSHLHTGLFTSCRVTNYGRVYGLTIVLISSILSPLFRLMFLGRLFRVDLIKPVSNVRPSVTIRTYIHLSTKKLL